MRYLPGPSLLFVINWQWQLTSSIMTPLKTMDDLRTLIIEEVDAHSHELEELSLKIHDNPELGLQEARASAWLGEYLKGKGFSVQPGICNLPTSFRASYGRGQPAIAFIAEYDALPEVGHACGHNIIAASAAGAAIAAKRVVDRLGGTILVIGTPGEELYGCKANMVDKGGFGGVDAAMMVHPATENLIAIPALACISIQVEFFGKAAHAAANPEEGINSLEALILSFNNVNSLRQHIKERNRIHGIILKGGEAANVVPDYTKGLFLVRAENETELEVLKEQVLNCFAAASVATGARLQYGWGDITYAPLLTNRVLANRFAHHLESLGRKVQPEDPRRGFGSTDMGNVSQVVPSIHPFVAIAPREVLVHSEEFASAAGSESGHQGMLDGAKAMALTALDLLADSRLLEKVKEDFVKHGKMSNRS